MDVHLGGFLRLELDHFDDVQGRISDSYDGELKSDGFIPFAYTTSNDLFVVFEGQVFFRNSGNDEMIFAALSLNEFLDRILIEEMYSEEEKILMNGRLRDCTKLLPGLDRKKICEEASKLDNYFLVKDCIKEGLPIGRSMRFAAMNGNWNIVDYLIKLEHNVNELQEDGRTVLDWLLWKHEYAEKIRSRGGVTSTELSSN